MIRFDKRQLSSQKQSKFETSLDVRFQDIDAAGIVFFSRFFDYAHAAYESFLSECGHPLAKVLIEKKWAAPLRHAEADYLSPARFGDKLKICLALAHVDDSEISLGWQVKRLGSAQEAPVALVQTVHTFVSLPEFKRCSVPIEIANQLLQLGRDV